VSANSDALLALHCARLGIVFEDDIRPGANYDVAVEHDGQVWISGQVPRVLGTIAVSGALGAGVSLDDGQRAAAICVLRALTILRQRLGSLARVQRLLRMSVYVNSDASFTQHSEVADAASAILYEVFAPHGAHARTSIGVVALPKNAAVELDLVVALQRP